MNRHQSRNTTIAACGALHLGDVAAGSVGVSFMHTSAHFLRLCLRTASSLQSISNVHANHISTMIPTAYCMPTTSPRYSVIRRFNRGKSKTDVEWQIYRAREIPGPLDYPAPKIPPAAGGGHMGSRAAKGPLEWRIYEHKDLPAPHGRSRHGWCEGVCCSLRPFFSGMRGGQFPLGNPSSK